MNAQDVTFGVALLGFLGTISVQFINYLSTVHSKALDERQKQEDRKQELRKIFFTRKLEAGEIVAARVTLLINQLHQIHAYYATFDASDHNNGYNTARLEEIREEQRRVNMAITADKNFSLLYFARLSTYNQVENESVKHNRLLTELVHLENEIDALVQLFHESGESGERDSITQRAIDKAKERDEKLVDYLNSNTEWRRLLLESCDELYRQLSQYEFA